MKSKRRSFWKFLGFLSITVVLVLIILAAVSKIYEDKIVSIALRKVSESIDTPMGVGDVSFTLIRRFPTATLEFEDVWLGRYNKDYLKDSIQNRIDTLANIRKLYLSLKSKELLKNRYELSRIELFGVDLKYLVDSKGVSNFDFLLDTNTAVETVDTSETTPLFLSLEKLVLEDIHCRYFDSTSMIGSVIDIPQMKISGQIQSDNYQGTLEGEIVASDVFVESTNLYRMQQTKLTIDATYLDDTLRLSQFDIETDGAGFSVEGKASFGDVLYTNMHITGNEIRVEELKKYAPDTLLPYYGIQQIGGTLDITANVAGVISDSVLPFINAQVELRNGQVRITDVPPVENLSIKASYTNGFLKNNQTTIVELKKLKGNVGQSTFEVSAVAQDLDDVKYASKMNFSLYLDEFQSFIPDSLKSELHGRVDVSLKTQGELPDSITDAFTDYLLGHTQADIKLMNLSLQMDTLLHLDGLDANLSYKPKRLKIEGLKVNLPDYRLQIKNSSIDASVQGSVTQPAKMGVDLHSLHLVTDGASIITSASLSNLECPNYSLKGVVRLNLDELQYLIPDTLINHIGGKLMLKYASNGTLRLDSIDAYLNDILFRQSSFQLSLDGISLDMPDTLMNVKNLSGEIDMQPDTLRIEKFKGSYAGINFMLDSTKIARLYESVMLEKDTLFFSGNIHLSDLNYAMLAAFVDSDTTVDNNHELAETKMAAEKDEEVTSAPMQFMCKGKLFISSVTYEKALFEDISAKFKLTPEVYVVDQLIFNAFEGKMNSSIRYIIGENGRDQMFMKNKIDQMNVKKLLADFDNFSDEPSITSEQISGLLSTDLDGKFILQDFVPYTDSIIFRGGVKLENGGLFNFEPATDLSKLTRIDELDNMKFKTIDSDIFIYKNMMYVPTTLIRSNAIDIEAFGMQSFGDDYEYHLRMFPGEVLLGKTKRIRKKQGTWGDHEEYNTDGLVTFYLIAYSLDGQTKSGFEKEKAPARTKMNMKIRTQDMSLGFLFQPKLIDFKTGVE